MKVKRMTEVETNRPKIGDRISFTLKTGEKAEAMAVKELINGTVFCTVDYLNRAYPMNRKGGTRGGYEASDLRKILNGEILDSFPDGIREQLIPFDNGDLLRIPFFGEIFGQKDAEYFEPDGCEQWELMKDRKNRVAFRQNCWDWGWLQNKRKGSAAHFCYVNIHGTADAWGASCFIGVRPAFQIARESILD